jgi:hypothetical protein
MQDQHWVQHAGRSARFRQQRFRSDARASQTQGFWYLARRVPEELEEFRGYAKTSVAYLSTGIRILDDPKARKAAS